jgi:hypothetical protein
MCTFQRHIPKPLVVIFVAVFVVVVVIIVIIISISIVITKRWRSLDKSFALSSFYDSDKLFVSIIDKLTYVLEVWNKSTRTQTVCAFLWNNEAWISQNKRLLSWSFFDKEKELKSSFIMRLLRVKFCD